jgi:hypothetical protein
MSDFFAELGKQVAAELGRPSGNYPVNPNVRAELSRIMNVRLDRHLSRPPQPTAQDTAFDNLGARMMPRGPRYGDQDPSEMPAEMDAQTCLHLIQRCLAGLTDPNERNQLVEGLSNLLQADDWPGSGGNNNGNGMDRRRRAAQDRRMQAQDAALVRDLHAKGFQARWGDLVSGIKFGGTGR